MTIQGIFSKFLTQLGNKKTNTPYPDSRPFPVSDCNYEKANDLTVKATKFRDTDILKAISLLNEATILDPSNKEISFKLARYLRLGSRRDDSFAIYRKMLMAIDPDDWFMSNFDTESIFQEMMVQVFEEKKYTDYLHLHLSKMWCTLCGLASQGRFNDGGFDFLNDNFFLLYGAQTKIKKALKSLKIEHHHEEISIGVYNLIKVYLEKFRCLSNMATKSSLPHDEHVQKMNANKQFMDLYYELSDPLIPDRAYKEIIQPLINSVD